MIALEEAASAINRKVLYLPKTTRSEEGVITGTSSTYIFVRYGKDIQARATNPEDLVFLTKR